MLGRLLLAAFAAAAVSGCGSASLRVGDAELTERDVQRLLEQLPDTVRLVSAYESRYVVKEEPAAYARLVVVTPGMARIAGRVFENALPIVLDISRDEFYAPGEGRQAGSDYFVYLVPRAAGSEFQTVLSRYCCDWTGYFSPGAGLRPRGYSPRTWKLLGYFHVGPQGQVMRNSVVTNDDLNAPAPGTPLPGMVKVDDFAIDIYENSELNGCCVSVYGRTPITGVNCDEARAMARLCGKKLPTSAQWLAACEPGTFPRVLSSRPLEGEGPQNVWSGQIALTGYFASVEPCNSAMSGCVDMVGNVWEWCEEVMDVGALADEAVPDAGYITGVAAFMGIPYWPAATSNVRPVECPGYFFIDRSIARAGIARGGSCEDGDKAGPGALLLGVARPDASAKVGFRCVR